MWVAVTVWDHNLRRQFNHDALDQRFPLEFRQGLLAFFIHAYEVVYHREHSQSGFNPDMDHLIRYSDC